jgi:hypothetical protein
VALTRSVPPIAELARCGGSHGLPQDHVHLGRTSDLNAAQEQLQNLFGQALGHTRSQREEAFLALRGELSERDLVRRAEVDSELDELASFDDVDSTEFEARLRTLAERGRSADCLDRLRPSILRGASLATRGIVRPDAASVAVAAPVLTAPRDCRSGRTRRTLPATAKRALRASFGAHLPPATRHPSLSFQTRMPSLPVAGSRSPLSFQTHTARRSSASLSLWQCRLERSSRITHRCGPTRAFAPADEPIRCSIRHPAATSPRRCRFGRTL